ncbi:MAG: hypothetical protein ACLT64_08090 [Streptococcus salivarius]
MPNLRNVCLQKWKSGLCDEFLDRRALGLAIMLGVRAATVVEHKRKGESWKTIIKEELHDDSSENSGE